MMNKLILGLAGIAFVFVGGLLTGKKLEYQKRQEMIIKAQEASLNQLKQQQELSYELEEMGNEYYEKYQDALNSEPVTVDRIVRVSVKADCPDPAVSKNTSSRVGKAEQPYRAELQRETVRRITALADKWQADLLQCQAQHQSLLNKIKAYNNVR